MDRLDLYDKKILFELDVNARTSASKIAKKLKIPKETVNYRINKLLREKYIDYFYTIVNASLLGYNYTKVFLKIDKMTSKKEDELVYYLLSQKKTSNIRTIQGNYEIVFLVMHKTGLEFKQFMKKLLYQFGSNISEKSIHTITESHKLNQKIVFGGEQYKKYFVHEKKDSETDALDKKLISALMQNSRARMSDIAKEIGEDPMKLTYRRKALEKKGIIVGYATKLNILKLGFERVELDLALTNFDSAKSIIEFFDQKNMCFFAYEMIGKYDLSIEMAVKNDEHLRKTMDEFKQKYFSDFKEYEISHIYKECVSSWSPFKGTLSC